MIRREFITLVGGAAAWPVVARAQQAKVPVIGFLSVGTAAERAPLISAFHQGLSETGFVVGRNVEIDYRWAEDHNARFPALVGDLIRRQVTVIAAGSLAAALAAKAATTTTPIVFAIASDPVEIGLVASLSRPGGNITGATNLNQEVLQKRLELLHELVPAATSIALLVNPSGASAGSQGRDAQAAARALGLKVHVLEASNERDFDTTFATMAQLRTGALVISSNSYFTSRSKQLAELTVRYAVPAMYEFREFATAGGLISYGTSIAELYRQVGVYTGRILKGEKPADLPVQQATKIELFINLKTAKALGITVPLPLLGRADEVIE